MHAILWTCFLPALLLSTAALSETADTFTNSAVIGQKAALKCKFRSLVRPLLQSWKAETQTAHNCFMSISTDENKRFENCSKHINWTPASTNYSTLYVNPVGIADDGLYTFDTAIPGEGTYNCYITLKVQGPSGYVPPARRATKRKTVAPLPQLEQEEAIVVPVEEDAGLSPPVPPEVTLTTDSSGAALCRAARGKPAANISWDPACEDCIVEYLPHRNRTVTVTSKYRARSENETGAVCIVSHPTFEVPHNLSGGLSYQESGANYFDTLIIGLSVTICFIITVLTLGFFFYWKPQQLRQCYKFTCGQETSLQRDQHNAEVVEEVEPYASYMQKVNTIYCSITELSPECMPDGSQVELRNYPTNYWN